MSGGRTRAYEDANMLMMNGVLAVVQKRTEVLLL